MQDSLLIPGHPSHWLFAILAIGTLAMGLLRVNYYHYFVRFQRNPLRNNVFDDNSGKINVFDSTMDVWSIIVISTVLTLIVRTPITFADWAFVARIGLIIGVFLAFQGMAYALAGYVFEDQLAHYTAWREKLRFIRWSALWITPVAWILAFGVGSPYLLSALALGFLILLYAWSLTRTAQILWNTSHLRRYHILLYLCALEIGPLTLLVLTRDW